MPGVIATPYGLLDPNPTAGEKIIPRQLRPQPGTDFCEPAAVEDIWIRPGARGSDGRSGGPGGPRPGGPGPGFFGPATTHRYNLTFSISARNILNHVNPGPIIGNINSPLFGESNQLAGGYGAFASPANNRRIELQLRFGF